MTVIEIHGGKQIKATEEHGKQVVQSNAIIKKFTEKNSPELLRQKRSI